MMKKILWISILTLIACQNTKVYEKSNEAADKLKNSIIKAFSVLYEVQTTSFKDYYTQGSVVSKKIAYIKPEINGSIKTIHVGEGDYIMKGSYSNNIYRFIIGSNCRTK